ncbi:g7663 [Coccomyxa elongata]
MRLVDILEAVDRGLEPGPLENFTISKWVVLLLVLTTHHNSLQPVHAQNLRRPQGSGPTLADAIRICVGVSAAQGDLLLDPGDQCIQNVLHGQEPFPVIPVVPKKHHQPACTHCNPIKDAHAQQDSKANQEAHHNAFSACDHACSSQNIPACHLPRAIPHTTSDNSCAPDHSCSRNLPHVGDNASADDPAGLDQATWRHTNTDAYGIPVPTFVYDHQCATLFFDPKYGCSSSSECADGEVCVDFGTRCVEAVCAVEATPSNCGKTFDCGLKDQCDSASTTIPAQTATPSPQGALDTVPCTAPFDPPATTVFAGDNGVLTVESVKFNIAGLALGAACAIDAFAAYIACQVIAKRDCDKEEATCQAKNAELLQGRTWPISAR